jgi:glycosyltransferase involved in cell wall biosynthesis
MKPSIVVLTPLKNDAWILGRFLEVTSSFADHIIIADQGSTDGGLEICARYEKVTVIANSDSHYDEASRQRLLIAAARAMVPMPRLLVALDADEILAADAMSSDGWQAMLSAAPGSSISFEKPNLYLSTSQAERRPLDFPGAFMDDAVTQHEPLRIHSPRLPTGKTSLVIDDVKFLHYALVRPEAQKAKMRMYTALENVMATKSLYTRRRYYWSRKVLRTMGPIEPSPPEWFDEWSRRGIDMHSIDDAQPYWQDLATLGLLRTHGSRRFWLDDLWGKDWRALDPQVDPPPRFLTAAINVIQNIAEWIAMHRQAFRVR